MSPSLTFKRVGSPKKWKIDFCSFTAEHCCIILQNYWNKYIMAPYSSSGIIQVYKRPEILNWCEKTLFTLSTRAWDSFSSYSEDSSFSRVNIMSFQINLGSWVLWSQTSCNACLLNMFRRILQRCFVQKLQKCFVDDKTSPDCPSASQI